MPQFESVEEIRRVAPGQAGTLIPSWNTGFALRPEPRPGGTAAALVRPGQKLHVLEARDKHVRVRLESDSSVEGWLPEHLVAPWPDDV
jgi:hypothetical protein